MKSIASVVMAGASSVVVGIDMAEEKFDVSMTGATKEIKTFVNNATGHSEFIESLKGLNIKLVLMEATGKCETLLALALEKAQVPYKIESLVKLRNFSKALGIIEKTDGIDARAIALAGERLNIQPSERGLNIAAVRLRENIQLRNSFIDEKVRFENQMRRLIDSEVPKILKSHIASLKKLIAELTKRIKSLITENEALKAKYDLMTTATGVGFATASTLIAELPELGEISRTEISKLAGLAPMAKESGKITCRRHIRGGRRNVRCALYMATLTAMKKNELIKPFYDRLREKGKAVKVAMTACAHKLLILLNSMLKLNRPWNEFCQMAKDKNIS